MFDCFRIVCVVFCLFSSYIFSVTCSYVFFSIFLGSCSFVNCGSIVFYFLCVMLCLNVFMFLIVFNDVFVFVDSVVCVVSSLDFFVYCRMIFIMFVVLMFSVLFMLVMDVIENVECV